MVEMVKKKEEELVRGKKIKNNLLSIVIRKVLKVIIVIKNKFHQIQIKTILIQKKNRILLIKIIFNNKNQRYH